MGRSLLVVDDSRLARLAVARALAAFRPGWRVLEAPNADDALVLAKTFAPDVAVIDFNMPGRDGLQLAADLRALRPRMPLAIVSANFQTEVVERARRIRADFLPKPLQRDAFGAFLEKAESAVMGSDA
jgi:DNA-binding NarL/FixJ family response regulator